MYATSSSSCSGPRIASPTSCEDTSAQPRERISPSTCWASMASWSSVTGLPWQARRTPLTILSRVNGSVVPLRLPTIRITVSWVVNLRPHEGHARRRRIAVPSSPVRLSMTRLSGFLQYGQNTRSPPVPTTEPVPRTQLVDEPHRCNYYMLCLPQNDPQRNTRHAATPDSLASGCPPARRRSRPARAGTVGVPGTVRAPGHGLRAFGGPGGQP